MRRCLIWQDLHWSTTPPELPNMTVSATNSPHVLPMGTPQPPDEKHVSREYRLHENQYWHARFRRSLGNKCFLTDMGLRLRSSTGQEMGGWDNESDLPPVRTCSYLTSFGDMAYGWQIWSAYYGTSTFKCCTQMDCSSRGGELQYIYLQGCRGAMYRIPPKASLPEHCSWFNFIPSAWVEWRINQKVDPILCSRIWKWSAERCGKVLGYLRGWDFQSTCGVLPRKMALYICQTSNLLYGITYTRHRN